MTTEENDAKALTLIASITTIYKSYEEEKLCDYIWEFAELYASIDIARDVFNHSQWQSTELNNQRKILTERDETIVRLNDAIHELDQKLLQEIIYRISKETGITIETLNDINPLEWDGLPKLILENTDNAE